MFLGDSYTVGVGGDGYVTEVADALGWSVVVEAESGTGYVAEGPHPETSPYGERLDGVVADEPDVVVQDSTNDVGSPDDAVRDAALSLYRRLAVALPDSDVVVVGSLAPPGADPAGVQAVRAALAQAASTAGLSFIDPVGEEWLQPPEGRFADPVHPNDAGYREMADRLMADLQLRGY